MFKIDNEMIEIKVFKKGNLVKRDYLKNRLTNLYLDYILYRMLPTSVADAMFPNFDDTLDNQLVIFSTAYLSIFDQNLNDNSTEMFFNQTSEYPLLADQVRVTTGDNDKVMEIDFGFTLSSIPPNTFLKTIGFGRFQPSASEWLFSFINVSDLNIGIEDDMKFVITRYDRITSNAKGENGNYFPFLGGQSVLAGRLSEIRVCYDRTGSCTESVYDVDDLTFTRISAGYVQISGFDNFFLSQDGLFPSDDLFMDYNEISTSAFNVLVETKNGYLYTLSGLNVLDVGFVVGKEYRAFNGGRDVFFKVVEVNTDLNFVIVNADGNQLEVGTDMTNITEIEYNLFPQIKGKPERFVFVYDLNDDTRQEVHVDMKDLDATYNNGELKINYKIERGGL